MVDSKTPDDSCSEASLEGLGQRSTLASTGAGGTAEAGVRLHELDGEASPAPARHTTDRYEILTLLGRGGMGEVYLAYDHDLKRRVALKVIAAAKADSSFSTRFFGEAQVLGQLEHPNIVPIHDVGLAASRRPYYTMRRVRGRNLRQVLTSLRDGEPQIARAHSLIRLVQVFLQVTQALSYAHAKGVIHRDLKPSNVMLGEHGEVQVVDWGLAKVFNSAEGEAGAPAPLEADRAMVGTPGFMAPEQIENRDVDQRTDVYALGCLLYQVLTLAPPFVGSRPDVMARQLREDPPAPRARAPERDIPRDLERACLKAMKRDPAERYQSARELYDAVQAWLEEETDRSKRHALAEAKAGQGAVEIATYRRLKSDIRHVEEELENLARRYQGWQSVREKADLFSAQDRLAAARKQIMVTRSNVLATLTEAVGFEGDNASARGLLADFYWENMQEAEELQNDAEQTFFAELVARYHDGKYDRQLVGDGSLSLDTEPSGAEVILYRLVEQELELKPVDRHPLGRTPLGPLPLAMGRYLAILSREGFPELRYPIAISRNREWTGTVRLPAHDEMAPGFIAVPAGPFPHGRDPETRGWSLPPGDSVLDDFFIAEHPVTVEDYLEFLNHLGRRDPGEALRRAPRGGPEGQSYVIRTGAGELRIADDIGPADGLAPRMPIISISGDDAVAYCAWRSAREGRAYRLPTDLEWEKAARGVDGRWYPWGNRFDPSLCNMKDSRPSPALLPVDGYPTDVSVYGVRGLAGNVRDWTATTLAGEGGTGTELRVVRGGSWNLPENICRCSNRFWLASSFVFAYVGFRLAYSPRRP